MSNQLRQQRVQTAQVEVINIFNVDGTEFSIKAILEPFNRFSEAGGTISVITEDFSGSCFFSHAGDGAFKSFISECYPDYLIGKLFKCQKYIPVTSTNEIIQWVAVGGLLCYLKDARHSNEVSKSDLRKCYELLKDGKSYYDYESLCRGLEGSFELEILFKIFGDDLLWEKTPSKLNPDYQRLEMLIGALIKHLKNP